MASLPIVTILEQIQVSPPETTVGDKVLPLTYFDFMWLNQPPIHSLFFYELPVTQTQFMETIIPNLKHSLSITLQHFYPFAGNLFVFPTSSKKPEIRYVDGDSVMVTLTECNLDFNELIGNHPRDSEMFYHLIPPLNHVHITSEFTKIPLFFVQVTLFPNSGISIGFTKHHCVADASTKFYFLKAWTSIAQSGSLADGTMPFYDRSIENPKLEESYLKTAQVENFEEYQPPKLCGPTDKVRATFVIPRTVLTKLKKMVSTQLPMLPCVSSFIVACAYIWSCLANKPQNELQMFCFLIDCRARMNPSIPAAYFGNCLAWCCTLEQSERLTGKQGFLTAAKLLGETLHETLTNKNGLLKERAAFEAAVSNMFPTSVIGVAGTPKLKFYDMDFGWGKPRKVEIVSTDYGQSISMNACRDNDEDLEIGFSLPRTEMESIVRTFKDELEAYV